MQFGCPEVLQRWKVGALRLDYDKSTIMTEVDMRKHQSVWMLMSSINVLVAKRLGELGFDIVNRGKRGKQQDSSG